MVSIFWRHVFKNSIKNKMLISIMSALAIPIFVFGIVEYWLTSGVVMNQTNKVYTDMLNQTKNSVETGLYEIDALALTLAKCSWVNEIAYMQGDTIDYERMDRIKLAEYCEVFGIFKSLNSLIYKAGLVFYNKNTVITPKGTEDMNWYFKHSFRFEKFDLDEVYNMVKSNPDKKIVYPSNVYYYDEKRNCLVILKRLPLLKNMENIQLIVSIKTETLCNLLQNDHMNGLSSYIIDGNNNVITGVNGNSLFENALKEAAFQKENEVFTADNLKYHIFLNKSDITNWTYVVIIPEKVILGKVNDIRDTTLWICVFIIIVGIILSYGITIRNYNPFKRLYDTVMGTSERKKRGNSQTEYDEVELLERAFKSMALNGKEMKKKMDECIPFAMHSFFIKLLHGLINSEEIPAFKKLMGINNELYYWTVALLLYNEENKEKDIEKKLLQWNAGMEESVYLIQVEKNRIALIVNTNDVEASLSIIKNSKNVIMSDNINTDIMIGIGRSYESIADLSKSYLDAVIAVEYIYYSSYSSKPDEIIALYDDIKRERRMNYYYPMEKEEILINYLRTGNIDKVKETLNSLLEENIIRHQISQFSMKCLFYDLISTALKVLQGDELLNVEMVEDSVSMLQLSIKDMRVYIEDIYFKICMEVQTKKGK